MAASPPVLEVIATQNGLLLGKRFELTAPLYVGRASTNDVTLNDVNLGRKHCRFTAERSRVRVEHLGSTVGTFINGRRLVDTAVLSPGDCVEVPGTVFRVAGGQGVTLTLDDPLLKAVEGHPDDDGLWHVWQDELLAKGDALGTRIAVGRGADEVEDARALSTLACAFVDGSLEITWRHGFIDRAVLRSLDVWYSTSWLRPLTLLLQHPLAHFMRFLEVDALSYARGADREALHEIGQLITESLDRIAAAGTTPVLSQVRFGPVSQVMWWAEHAIAWRRCTDAMPRLSALGPIWVARAAWLQLLSTPRGVSISGLDVGAQRALKEEQANLIGPRDADFGFAIHAPDDSAAHDVGLRIDRELGVWWVTDVPAERLGHGYRWDHGLQVNGRECVRHRLRPGDLIEPAPGLLFRFIME
jgi:hypothetical protein